MTNPSHKILTNMIILALIALFIGTSLAQAAEKYGLMIVAHGSMGQEWNQKLEQVHQDVVELQEDSPDNPFCETAMAFLEFVEPSVYTVVTELERKGIDKVVVIPVFVAPSGHSVRDVPAVLGLYSDSEILQTLSEEGVEIPDTKMRFVLGPTMYPGTIVPEIALEKVLAKSTDPENEALVVLAHGDRYYQAYWDEMIQETGRYICAKSGIENHDGAFIHIGQHFATDGLTIIQKALEEKETVIVANLFFSMDLPKIADASTVNFMGHAVPVNQMLKGKDVRYCEGLLPDKRVADWVWTTALGILKGGK